MPSIWYIVEPTTSSISYRLYILLMGKFYELISALQNVHTKIKPFVHQNSIIAQKRGNVAYLSILRRTSVERKLCKHATFSLIRAAHINIRVTQPVT